MTLTATRVDAVEAGAPDVVAAWRLVFAGVHDLIHLEQVHALATRIGDPA